MASRSRLVDEGGVIGSLTWSGPYLIYRHAERDGGGTAVVRWDSRTAERSTSDRPGAGEIPDLAPISALACP